MRRLVPALLAVSLGGAAPSTGGCDGAPTPASHDLGAPPPAPDLSIAAPVDAARPSPASLDVKMLPFTLQPGEEKILCQYFPPDGKERWVNRFVTDMSPGSHHLVVFRVFDKTGRPGANALTPCSQLDIPDGFDGLLPGSQRPHTDVALPDGVAMRLEAHHGVLLQSHYINASQKPITADVRWTAHAVEKEAVREYAGMLFYSIWDLAVPVGTSTQARTCKAPRDLRLVMATGHMHKRGLAFDASVAGAPIYHTKSWDEPDNAFFPAPGHPVLAGQPISWACTYQNETMSTIRFGNSAATNEMCILVALFYPSPDGSTDFACLN